MAKKDKAAGKKRDVQAAAEKPAKKAKKQEKATEEPPAAAKEEESEELEGVEDFEGMSEGSGSEEGEPSPAFLWQMALEARAQELNAFACLVGNLEKEDAEEQQQQQSAKGKGNKDKKGSKGKGDDDDDDGGSDSSEGDESEEESDEEEPSIEKLEAMTRLFLPKKTEDYVDDVMQLLQNIGCTPPSSEEEEEEDEDEEGGMDLEQRKLMRALMMPGLRMLNTKHSLPMQAVIKDALGKVDKELKSKHWEEAFCRWAAVLLACTDEGHWYADTEDQGAVVSIWKQLNKQWGQIKKHSVKDLGNPSCEGGKSPDVKHTLDFMLSRLGDSIREVGVDGI